MASAVFPEEGALPRGGLGPPVGCRLFLGSPPNSAPLCSAQSAMAGALPTSHALSRPQLTCQGPVKPHSRLEGDILCIMTGSRLPRESPLQWEMGTGTGEVCGERLTPQAARLGRPSGASFSDCPPAPSHGYGHGHDRLHFLRPSRSRWEGPPPCHGARAGPHPSVSVSQGSPRPGIEDWLRNLAGLVLRGTVRHCPGLSGEVHPASHKRRSLGRAFWLSRGSSGASPELGRSLVGTWGEEKSGRMVEKTEEPGETRQRQPQGHQGWLTRTSLGS